MSNEEMLNKRWKMTDKILISNLKKFKTIGIDTIDYIVEMINSLDINYNDLNKPISKADKRKLDKNIKEWKKQGLLVGYFTYLVSSKSKLTYADLIEILIYGIYNKQEKSVNEVSKTIFEKVANDIYNQALDEIPEKPKKKFSLTWEYIWSLLWIPTYNKKWDEYLKLLTMTNQQEMYKLILGNLQQNKFIKEDNLKNLVQKQINRIINVNDDKYSGVLSDACHVLGNKIYTEPFKEKKDLQVRFIAEMDKRTTKMCESMNDMLFFVNDWNKFYRYSEIDKKDVLYTCKGLEIGVNLPPINNHFHWCRSTITYLIENDIRKKYRDITKEWKRKKIKQNAKVELLNEGDIFIFKGNEYIIDNHHVKYRISIKEKEFAQWLAENISKKIQLNPEIEYPEKISVADCLIDQEYYDMKIVSGKSSQILYHNIRGKEKQSSNFLFEATESILTLNDLEEQIEIIFNRKDMNFVKKIGIKKDNQFKLYQKK